MSFLKRISTPTGPARAQDPFSQMEEMFNRWMSTNNWNENWPQSMKCFGADFNPHLEVKETKTDYNVSVELPGMNKEDIKLDFENNTLYIRGEKKIENERKEGEKVNYSERYYGSFTRTVPFTEEVDSTKINAEYTHGILSLTLPKKPTDQTSMKTIAIR